MATSSSAPDLLVQGLVEELYRRRATLGLIASMALILAATAIGFQVWGPGDTNQVDAGFVNVQPPQTSTAAVGQPVRIKAPELWITPNSASGARVWVRSTAAATSSTSAGG